jgi:N-methylhydantoinase B/oxoprolinase/acetone carboxylase alpha subunit
MSSPLTLVETSLLILDEAVIAEYGLETVQEYMFHIRNNAEMSVRDLLRTLAKRLGTTTLSAVDYLDDGSPVGHPSPSSHRPPFIRTHLILL